MLVNIAESINVGDREYAYTIQMCFGVYEVVNRTVPVSIMCDRAQAAISSIKEDYRKYRETYWRRLPQMPGASYCPVHQVRLRASGVSFGDIQYKLFPATYALNHIQEPESDDGNVYEEEFLRLAEDIDWLLNKGFSFSDSEWIQRSFAETTGKQINVNLPAVNPDGENGKKRFEDYLVSRLYREIGTLRIPETIRRQVGTILSIEEAFGTVEQFFLSYSNCWRKSHGAAGRIQRDPAERKSGRFFSDCYIQITEIQSGYCQSAWIARKD